MVDGALVEAKYGYEAFLNKAGDGIVDWFGEKNFLKEAVGQLQAAEGTPIKWFFDNEKVANVVRDLFESKGLNIEVIFQKLVE